MRDAGAVLQVPDRAAHPSAVSHVTKVGGDGNRGEACHRSLGEHDGCDRRLGSRFKEAEATISQFADDDAVVHVDGTRLTAEQELLRIQVEYRGGGVHDGPQDDVVSCRDAVEGNDSGADRVDNFSGWKLDDG